MKRDIENVRYDWWLEEHEAFKSRLQRRCLQLTACLIAVYLIVHFYELYTAQPPV